MIDTFTLWIEYRDNVTGIRTIRSFPGISRVAIDYYENYYNDNHEIINIGWEETKYLRHKSLVTA